MGRLDLPENAVSRAVDLTVWEIGEPKRITTSLFSLRSNPKHRCELARGMVRRRSFDALYGCRVHPISEGGAALQKR